MSARSQLNTRVKVFYLKYLCCYVVLDSLDWLSQKQLFPIGGRCILSTFSQPGSKQFSCDSKACQYLYPPPPLMLQAVAILEYATPMNFVLIASPIQAALSSLLSLKCCYAGYPFPVFSFFYVGTKCCFDHVDLITLQHKRLIYLTTIWIKLAGRGPLHFRLTLNSNFLLSQI